jgi:hypothetical protein
MRKSVVAVVTVVATLAIGAPSAAAQEPEQIRCDNTTLTGVIDGDVFVPFNRTCVIQDAFLTGDVLAATAARSTRIERSIVRGDVSCFDCGRFEIEKSAIAGEVDLLELARGVRVCGSVVGGEAAFGNMTDEVAIGNLSTDCNGNVFGRSLTLTRNLTPTSVERNIVARDLVVNLHRADVTLNQNVVGGSLSCADNNTAPTGSQNFASTKAGQCADL